MKEVTDPRLLAELENGDKEVTDPALLAQLEGQPEGKTLAGFGHNVVRNAGEIASGMGNLALGALTHPIDTSMAVAESIPGTVKQMGHDYAVEEILKGDFPGAAKRLGDTAYEKPVSVAMDVLPFTGAYGKAGKAAAGAAEGMAQKMGGVGEWFGKEARIQRLKTLAPSTKQVEELMGNAYTPEAALELGDFAKDKGIIRAYRSPEEMLKMTEPLENNAGAVINESRATGTQPPNVADLTKSIGDELTPKYTQGLEAGGASELERALEELSGTKPGYQNLANTSTKMNSFAKRQGAMMQPAEATTDVANRVSGAADSSLVQELGSDAGESYVGALDDYSKTQQIQQLLKHQTAGELSGRSSLPVSKFGMFSRAANAIAPHSMFASVSQKISDILRTAPQRLGPHAQALQSAAQKGGNALGVTTFVLQQRDPDFRETMRKIAEEDGNE